MDITEAQKPSIYIYKKRTILAVPNDIHHNFTEILLLLVLVKMLMSLKLFAIF